jgi:hypothetical protein
LFQWYVLEWIEIENRAMRFLDQHQLHHRCVTLHSPEDLNEPARIRAAFNLLDLVPREPLRLHGRKNRSLGYSSAQAAEQERQFAEVLQQLVPHYLEIFSQPPYTEFPWSRRLGRQPEPQLQS